MTVLATAHFEYLCNTLAIPFNGFNCGMFAAAKDTLSLMTLSEVNDILGANHQELDIVCDVVVFRMTHEGNLLPGEGNLPTVEDQRAVKEAKIKAEEEAFAQFCLENPNDPQCLPPEETEGEGGV